MIECPICQVVNEDLSRFCAECGQRLSADQTESAMPNSPAPAQDPNPGPTPEPPKPARPRLKSPLLSGSEIPAEEPISPTSKKGLRSPLLGKDEHFSANSKTGTARGLKSPLLGSSQGDDEPPNQPERGLQGLRSPLLGGAEPGRQPFVPPKPGGLRSPLLGQSDKEDPLDAPAGPSSGQRSSLRSPLLSGASESAWGSNTYLQPPEIIDDPNVLRSPLLAAKVPLTDRPSQTKDEQSLPPPNMVIENPSSELRSLNGFQADSSIKNQDSASNYAKSDSGAPSPNIEPKTKDPASTVLDEVEAAVRNDSFLVPPAQDLPLPSWQSRPRIAKRTPKILGNEFAKESPVFGSTQQSSQASNLLGLSQVNLILLGLIGFSLILKLIYCLSFFSQFIASLPMALNELAQLITLIVLAILILAKPSHKP